MQLLHTLLTVAYFSKVRILQFFPHKLTFSTAFLILFLLPISVRFRYLDHLVASRMAPSMCPDLCNEIGELVLSNSVTYFRIFLLQNLGFMLSAYLIKCCIRLTCLTNGYAEYVHCF